MMPYQPTLHGKSFTGGSLAVGQHCSVPPLEDSIDDRFGHDIKNLLLGRVNVEDVVEVEDQGLVVLVRG
jgi:hypothetical protein